MIERLLPQLPCSRWLAYLLVAMTVLNVTGRAALQAADSESLFRPPFAPGNLIVSRSVYHNDPKNVAVGTILPPNCTTGCSAATGATNDGTYPTVWNNDLYDGSFGITAKIFLDEMGPFGGGIRTLEVPNNLQHGIDSSADRMVTSFSSKSELALHLSTNGEFITFMGYVAPVDAIDVSNSNTPSQIDPTNPVTGAYHRAIAQMDDRGRFRFTETDAYSGNNGRAAIWNNSYANVFYTAGNAGNGGTPQPDGVILGAGAQIISPADAAESSQTPGTPTPVASFSITELGAKADKIGKDDNFRGMTIWNNVLYYTKGSGGNGVNAVYFVDTAGTCQNGVGLPSPAALLPTAPLGYTASNLQTTGLPNNMCILAGFPSTPNKTATTTAYPFGIWFANATTLHVADEGDGYTGGADLFTHAAAQTTAGLQKWVFDGSSKTWKLAYTLTNGLALGTPYNIGGGYPAGTNAATNLPWTPATDGLRNITGRVEFDGQVTLWAITSTVSGNGDTGADPNKLVVISDALDNTDPAVAAGEAFLTLRTAGFAEVLRGVSLTPRRRQNSY